MNTKVTYMYSDAANYRRYHSEIVCGTVSDEAIDDLRKNYDDAMRCFCPESVGFPSVAFGDAGPSPYTGFHELIKFEETNEKRTQPITIGYFIDAIKNGRTSKSQLSPLQKSADDLRLAIKKYCRMRSDSYLCDEYACVFCPIKRTYEMVKKDLFGVVS